MIVADTDVLIDFLRGGECSGRIEEFLTRGVLATTAVSAFELWVGTRSLKQETAVEKLLKALDIRSLCEESARKAAAIRKLLEARGSDIGMADSLIAGICLQHDEILFTRNQKHFRRVDGLRLENR